MVKSDAPTRKSARGATKQSAAKTSAKSQAKEAEAAKRAVREMYKKVPYSTFGHAVASNVLLQSAGGYPSFGIRNPPPPALQKQPKQQKERLQQLEQEAAAAVNKLYAFARFLQDDSPPPSPSSDERMGSPGEGPSGAGQSESVDEQRQVSPPVQSAPASTRGSVPASGSHPQSPADEDVPTEPEDEAEPSAS